MKLNTLISNLKKVKDKYGNLEVIYASDDEGNSFHEIFAEPTTMKRLTEGSNMTYDDLEEEDKNPDVVIIN